MHLALGTIPSLLYTEFHVVVQCCCDFSCVDGQDDG